MAYAADSPVERPGRATGVVLLTLLTVVWGSTFVVIQLIMVITVIMFPSMVMHYKAGLSQIDPNKVQIEIPQTDLPPIDFAPPNFK